MLNGGYTIGGNVVTERMLNDMLDEYYTLRGLGENGIPTKEKLRELDLQHLSKARNP